MIYLIKIFYIIDFLVFYLYDLTSAVFRIGLDIITIENRSKPGVVEVVLEAKTDWEIMLLANLITFSPGSMVVDLSEDRKKLLVYSMFADDHEALIISIKYQLERRVLRILR